MGIKSIFKVTYKYLGAILLFIPMFVLKGIGLGSSNRIAVIITIFALLISLVELVELRMNKKEFCVWFFVFIFLAVNVIMSGKYIMCLTIYSIFLLSKTDYEKLYKPLGLLAVILLVYHIAKNWNSGRIETRFINGQWKEIIKRGNMAYVIYYEVISLYTLIKKEKIRIIEIMGFLIFGIVLYLYSGTRSGLLCIMFFAFSLLIVKLKAVQKSKLIKWLMIYAPILFLAISMCMNYLFGRYRILDYVNSMLQNRLRYGKLFLDTYGVSLLGQKVVTSYKAETYQVMDNTYLNLVINYGLIVTVGWIILNIRTLSYLYKRKNYTGICVIIGYLLYAFTESFVIVGFLNMSIFLYCDYINKYKEYLKVKVKTRGYVYDRNSSFG